METAAHGSESVSVKRWWRRCLSTHHRIDPWNPKHPIPARTTRRGNEAEKDLATSGISTPRSGGEAREGKGHLCDHNLW